MTTLDFIEGAGLNDVPAPGDWRVTLAGGTLLGWLPCVAAMQYKRAAGRAGVTVLVFDK